MDDIAVEFYGRAIAAKLSCRSHSGCRYYKLFIFKYKYGNGFIYMKIIAFFILAAILTFNQSIDFSFAGIDECETGLINFRSILLEKASALEALRQNRHINSTGIILYIIEVSDGAIKPNRGNLTGIMKELEEGKFVEQVPSEKEKGKEGWSTIYYKLTAKGVELSEFMRLLVARLVDGKRKVPFPKKYKLNMIPLNPSVIILIRLAILTEPSTMNEVLDSILDDTENMVNMSKKSFRDLANALVGKKLVQVVGTVARDNYYGGVKSNVYAPTPEGKKVAALLRKKIRKIYDL